MYDYTMLMNTSPFKEMQRAEVTGPQAAQILGTSLKTVHRKVDAGVLPARKQGTGERKFLYIDVADLERFAMTYGYRFRKDLAQEFAE